VWLPDAEPLSYRELRTLTDHGRGALRWPVKALVAVMGPRTLPGLLGYLAALAAGHAVLLIEGTSPELWAGIDAAYQPDLVVTGPGGTGAARLAPAGFGHRAQDPFEVWARSGPVAASPPAPIHPQLGLILRTSGSIGPPKAARLSYDALRANALAITQALGLRRTDRVMTSLPLDFSFGLSLVNSHLAAGAGIVLSGWSPSTQLFWQHLDDVRATGLGAVPSTCRFWRGTGWQARDHPTLRVMQQSGGPLDEATLAYFDTAMRQIGGEFVPMYGQTEATARVTVRPPALAGGPHRGSVGRPVPGGHLEVLRPDGRAAADGETGEIVYSGPSVMMGYAQSRADLAGPDQLEGTLRTGDLGCLREGLLYITGRADRQVKIFGRRIDLEQLEAALSARGFLAAVTVSGTDQLTVVAEGAADRLGDACRALARELGLPPSRVIAAPLDRLPHTDRGKVDRTAVSRVAARLTMPR
jgi:acyl-CoA synthetase (AMP-forming)/AMP-acid ligase II